MNEEATSKKTVEEFVAGARRFLRDLLRSGLPWELCRHDHRLAHCHDPECQKYYAERQKELGFP